jgi:hypothetical protein
MQPAVRAISGLACNYSIMTIQSGLKTDGDQSLSIVVRRCCILNPRLLSAEKKIRKSPQSLDSRFRRNDDEGQSGWHERLLRKSPPSEGWTSAVGTDGVGPSQGKLSLLEPTPGPSPSTDG